MSRRDERAQAWAHAEGRRFISADKLASKAARVSRKDLAMLARDPALAERCERAANGDTAERAALYDVLVERCEA